MDSTKCFTDDALAALHFLSDCAALRVPFDDSEYAAVVKRQNVPESAHLLDWGASQEVPVSDSVRDEILHSGIVRLLTRKRHLNKIGWQEMGLDGTDAEFWCLTQ